MEKIGTILGETLENSGFKKRLMEAQIFLNYSRLVGEKIARISKPTFFRNSTLFIGVESPVWAHQLHFLKKDIMDKLNMLFKEPLVKDIKFQVSHIERDKCCDAIKRDKVKTVLIPDKTMKMIYNISSEIEDEELRKKFIQLMIKDREYHLKKEAHQCSST